MIALFQKRLFQMGNAQDGFKLYKFDENEYFQKAYSILNTIE